MFGSKRENYRHLQEQITQQDNTLTSYQLELDELRMKMQRNGSTIQALRDDSLAVRGRLRKAEASSGGFWKTAKGDTMALRDMSSGHIKNCIKGGFAEKVPGALKQMTDELKRRTECEVWERRTAEAETWDAAKGVSKAEIARAKAACTAAAMDDDPYDIDDPFPGIGGETSLEERIVEEAMSRLSPYEDVDEPVYQGLCKSVRELLDRPTPAAVAGGVCTNHELARQVVQSVVENLDLLDEGDRDQDIINLTLVARDVLDRQETIRAAEVNAVPKVDPLELRLVQVVQGVFDPHTPNPREACHKRASAKVVELLNAEGYFQFDPGKGCEPMAMDSTPLSIGSSREISRDTAVGQVFGKSDGLQHIEYPTFAIDGLQKPIFMGTLYGASLFVEEGTSTTICRYITKFLRGQGS